jgi:hypothetical protein
MPIVHQDHGFDFTIKAEDKKPPKVHVTGATDKKKYLLVRIGKPDQEYPYIDKYENVDQDEVNWVCDTIQDYQINFLTAWDRIHGGEWKTSRGPVKIGPKATPTVGPRLRLKPRANVEKIKELIGGIADRRFYKLQKKLIWDLDAARFKTIDLGLYMRLGGWSHTGGTYVNAMMEVKALCKAMFGYELPEKIGKVHMKDFRYRTAVGLAKIGQGVTEYHEKQLGK